MNLVDSALSFVIKDPIPHSIVEYSAQVTPQESLK